MPSQARLVLIIAIGVVTRSIIGGSTPPSRLEIAGNQTGHVAGFWNTPIVVLYLNDTKILEHSSDVFSSSATDLSRVDLHGRA